MFGKATEKKISFTPISQDSFDLNEPYREKFLQDINQAINEFNSADNPEGKENALIQMQKAIDYVDIHASPWLLERAPLFHKLKVKLFNQMKEAFKECGVYNLSKVEIDDNPLVYILSHMSLDNADKLMGFLSEGDWANDFDNSKTQLELNLKNLYESKDNSYEARNWRIFINNHSIEFLGGGNSLNYKVRNIYDIGPIKVLKVENRLQMPRNAELHLRNSVGTSLTSVDVSRQVLVKNRSRTLQVTDYCSQGSVDDCSMRARRIGDDETFKSCPGIMGQMAEILMDIEGANCFFPDAKLTNWLVDSNGRVQIADTKSFVFTENGIYKPDISGNEQLAILKTPGFLPPELGDFNTFNAGKLHSALFGLNLYTYLTGLWPNDKLNLKGPKVSASNLMDLNNPIFQTEIGKEYKELIEQLTKDPSETRMSLNDASEKLFELSLPTNPDYMGACKEAREVNKALGIQLMPYASKFIRQQEQQGVQPDVIAQQLIESFAKLKASATDCKTVMDTVAKETAQTLTPSAKDFFPSHQDVMGGLAKDATSIDDLTEKIDRSANELSDSVDYIQSINSKVAEYEQLKKSFKEQKVGKNDVQMEQFLSQCDAAVKKGSTLIERLENLHDQMEKMNKILPQLKSKENNTVKEIIEQFGAKDTFLSIGMGAKARRIEVAYANVPIEERVKLLQSDDPSVTSLLNALASHRINPFQETRIGNKINEKDAATSFKDFKNAYKEELSKRKDIEFEEQKQDVKIVKLQT